ncbi:mechanosensitive ion channel family protein [Tenacibaculum piscium]|uniref:Small-conductance mechanosensitive channel n=1 Tax=Tenacibaculum piscium TaxID=1458515 RepID=A0A2H1YKQ2_9FLAO|nr:hypothetical protein [Tenacibaculum piscium]MBE7628668.1 hypothetical protein [Tenacibaculum piscium]MBE7669809.1 hypothetical protein [Tenacibaculum piscium]MBE7684603.1 hypothetical protein [Tenacibaculum piscium]MBE7689223.1 hypothetical protein [Tenacibaculum piscium]SOS75457.1 conserved membrane hypothetical protein [Tenacibaculum piscium]
MNVLQMDILAPFKDVFQNIIDSLPTALGLVGFVILTWLIVKFFLYIVRKGLAKTKIDELSKKISKTPIFGNSTIKICLSTIITTLLKWFLILTFVMAGSNIFGLEVVSEGIKTFFAYLPKLLTAVGIFIAGVYLGTVIKKSTQTMFKSLEISGGNLVGNIAFYLIVVFLSITALDQAGVDTSIIKSNLTLLIGSILLAFTLAFGFGAKEVVVRLLYGYYSRKNIGIGQKVIIDDVKGVVTAIDNICLTVTTAEGKVVFPINDIVNGKIVIEN